MCFEIAVISTIAAVGNILFGHFEEGTPKWRRVTKIFVIMGIGVFISRTFGRFWFYVMLAMMTVAVTIIHAWWLPRHGINGLTGEPKDRYYELRGWKR
jgi:biotin transporter BioY